MVETSPNINKSQDADTEMYDISGGGIIGRILQHFNISISRWQLALAIVCIAWVPLAVLTLIDGTFMGGTDTPFIKDYSRQGRLLDDLMGECINRGMSHSEIGVSRTPKSVHVAH